MDVGLTGQRAAEYDSPARFNLLPTVIDSIAPILLMVQICSLGLTPFPPNKDGDDYGGHRDFAAMSGIRSLCPQPG